ncbi:MAG: sigma-70 family RNA polymerase sigma factor [Thermomicrobiales bacterium]
MTDDRLLERAQRGDREALDELCRREWRPIYGLAYSALGNAAEAQDLTQEAFLRGLRSLPAYRVSGVPFHAYLKAIALNLVRDGWRKRRHVTVPLDDALELPARETGPEGQALAADERRRLIAALEGLPPDHQTVIRLRLLDGLPAADTGRVMGRTPDAVRQLQHRALSALRATLSEGSRR